MGAVTGTAFGDDRGGCAVIVDTEGSEDAGVDERVEVGEAFGADGKSFSSFSKAAVAFFAAALERTGGVMRVAAVCKGRGGAIAP